MFQKVNALIQNLDIHKYCVADLVTQINFRL